MCPKMDPLGDDGEQVLDVGELRSHLARALQDRADTVIRDAIAVCLFAGIERVPAGDRAGLVGLAFRLLTEAVRSGELDPRGPVVAELGQFLTSRGIGARAAFHVVYLTERAAIDELSGDDLFGAGSQPWAATSQLIHRAAFDLCGALTEYLGRELAPAALVDPLTTLHTRSVFIAALEKEIHRGERLGHPFALILFDVDRLGEINATHGYGAGDRILERVGIIIRNYFRETDWVARTSGDGFAVILPEIQRVNAERLADRVRNMVRSRLQIHDHRTNQEIPVTVSAGVVIAESVDKSVRAEQMMIEAKEAVDRAKTVGRNRVESQSVVIGRTVAPTRAGMSMD
jgi:diguanylate cyclase (GGDEF)-like protein